MLKVRRRRWKRADKKEENNHSEIHLFVRFNIIYFLCHTFVHLQAKLSGRAHSIYLVILSYRKKYNQRAPFVSFFIKITALIPSHIFLLFFFSYLQLASTWMLLHWKIVLSTFAFIALLSLDALLTFLASIRGVCVCVSFVALYKMMLLPLMVLLLPSHFSSS